MKCKRCNYELKGDEVFQNSKDHKYYSDNFVTMECRFCEANLVKTLYVELPTPVML